MKINSFSCNIDKRYNFTFGNYSSSLFKTMLDNSESVCFSDENKYKSGNQELSNVPAIVPVDKDLVILSQKRIPRPFELSDKKLVLDEYQNLAVSQFKDGKNVMVTAPTGTGKTLIAEYIIDDILKSGKKVIYTTPLKALCNDKYKQFCSLWGDYDSKGSLIGHNKVGLATGDVKINQNAPLVIMTTEIYRNILTSRGEKDVEHELRNVDAIIFDEFHYMGDSQRGSTWEEALMFSPKRIRHLMLSATIANAKPISNWLNSINDDHQTVIVNVPEEERHVPLKHLAYSKINGHSKFLDLLDETVNKEILCGKTLSSREKDTFSYLGKFFNSQNGLEIFNSRLSEQFDFSGKASLNDIISALTKYGIPYKKAEQIGLRLSDKNLRKLNKSLNLVECMDEIPVKDLIKELHQKKMTPALYFVYSKRNCKTLMKETSDSVGQLLTFAERKEVQRKIDEVKNKGIFLGTDFCTDIMPCLLNGFAMHNAGMLPQCKSFIEELGRNKLIKVCFATDTLGAGINFPFKTVIFSSFEKFGDNGFDEISINSFKQGAGRAGRRGLDDVGYVVSILKDKDDIQIPFNKIIQDSDDINSSFKLSYGLVLSPRFLNNSHKVLDNSFGKFQNGNADENIRISDAMKNILKSRNFIEEKNHVFRLTQKGKVAAKIRGVNEILMSEILCDNTLMSGITPSEMATMIAMFSPERNEEVEIKIPEFKNPAFTNKIQQIVTLANSIKSEEENNGIVSDIKINPSATSALKLWADTKNSEDNSILWKNIVNSLIDKNAIKTEGDFLKKINYTINVLKQIQKCAPSSHLKIIAEQAVKMLQKSPVNDILLYELDYKENHE